MTRIWRRRALLTGTAMGVLSLAGIAVVWAESPTLWNGFRQRSWPLIAVALVCGSASLLGLWGKRFTWAVVAVVVTIATVIWSWLIAQYPAILPPHITIAATAAPANVLWTMIAAVGAGTILLAPSLIWLFVLFKGHDGSSKAAHPIDTSERPSSSPSS